MAEKNTPSVTKSIRNNVIPSDEKQTPATEQTKAPAGIPTSVQSKLSGASQEEMDKAAKQAAKKPESSGSKYVFSTSEQASYSNKNIVPDYTRGLDAKKEKENAERAKEEADKTLKEKEKIEGNIALTNSQIEDLNSDPRTPQTEPKTPEEAKETALDYLIRKGLVKINDDGSIDFGKLKQTSGSIASRVFTVLSGLLTVATGGAVPPINFYAISGKKAEDEARQEVYKNLLDQLSKTQGDIETTRAKSDFMEKYADLVKKAGAYDYWNSGAGERDYILFKYKIDEMKKGNVVAKDYADYMAGLNAKQIPLMIGAMIDSGYTPEQIREYVNTSRGNFRPDALQAADTVLSGIGTVASIVK